MDEELIDEVAVMTRKGFAWSDIVEELDCILDLSEDEQAELFEIHMLNI